MICGIGIDVVDVARIRRAEARWGDRFLKRVFTGREISYCRTKKDPHPHLAARFAAKEAVIKAVAGLWEDPTAFDSTPLTSGGPVDDPAGDHQNEGTQRVSRQRGLQPRHLGFRDIEILNHPTGRPYISLGAGFLKTPADLLIHLSMSHEEDVAVATVVLEKRSGQRL